MFEDSLMESGGKIKTKQGATAALSFGLQIILIGVLVLLPLVFTEALPKQQLMTFLVAPHRRHRRHLLRPQFRKSRL